ncbi:nuclear poly(A) polymerase 1 [Podospora aff. communis PSN243]|uniref:polynucleotide adenylyltransferase n=1 Tax=Podospora aff. communis PSN243 TaxID=3040156 RepID=A0AAV9GPA1_9PEZI|nr:nuclear poly(A) polymerase 1 [Podospora aff. communis PSN243]
MSSLQSIQITIRQLHQPQQPHLRQQGLPYSSQPLSPIPHKTTTPTPIMATTTTSSLPPSEPSIPTTSHDTALALIPPSHLFPPLNRLRSLYDKAYEKWPPHVNLIYPFVRPESLPVAAERISSFLSTQSQSQELKKIPIKLDSVGVFEHKRDNTIYLCDESPETQDALKSLRKGALNALGDKDQGRGYQMHMTIAQSEDAQSDTHKFLVDKVGLVPAVEWEVEEVYLLVRQRVQLDGTATSRMRVWGKIRLSSGKLERMDELLGLEEAPIIDDTTVEKDTLQTQPTHVFDDETDSWIPYFPSSEDEDEPPTTPLSIASYNVLAEFTHPPSPARYPLLLSTLLTSPSPILLLQEVTDSFLSFLLSSPQIRSLYPYTSHATPSQPDICPLPSLLNTVLLSSYPFSWEYIPLTRKHKSSLVAAFPTLGGLILAGVHLSCGLTDGSIASKKGDVQRVVKYLRDHHAGRPWVVAGDFNISTSKYTIEKAVEKKAVTAGAVAHMAGIDSLLAEEGLEDAWAVCKDGEEGEYPGEEGATYDPVVNEVAAEIVGSGYGMRPQRYDRVYVKGEGEWRVGGFEMFGREKGRVGEGMSYASDHWGVRFLLEAVEKVEVSEEISKLVVPVELVGAPGRLGSAEEALVEMGVFPTEEEAAKRKEALSVLKGVLLEAPADASRVQPTVVVVPVGSYALGVWTAASDIDVLCIGPFSANTFFALATQRIRKAAAQDVDIRILRRVRANTGTMLELEVLGIKMDLQYCPATSIAEQYPKILRAPPTSPVWSLSAPTLSKLKALRDIDYLTRSLHSSLPTFRLAHRFIKTWARSRGIYSARFGFLGSIQISLLLARVIKLLPGPVSLETLLTTFFTHYASFPWSTHLAFDPLFHTTRIPYHRTAREPLAILGYFPPALNTCATASAPSTRAIAAEFTLAASQIASTLPSWTSLLRPTGAASFLSSFPTYIRIDVQYWGISPSRGRRFIGWLESRCVMLLVDVHRRATGLHARMWPARFLVADSDAGGEEGRDYRGCYLIGLEKANPDMSKDETKAALGGLRSALGRFEEMMRGDEKYFDARSCWLAGEIVNRSDLAKDKLEVDDREWGEYTAGDDEEGDDDDDDDDEEEDEGEALGLEELDVGDTATKKKSKKQQRKEKELKQQEEEGYKLETGKKFRTAADVMNRIRWDPEMESSDFLVGYEDRFVGAREKALDLWKSEQTDEEFIPQHRILYFKRKSDGEVLWERRTRKDEIFGSGL